MKGEKIINIIWIGVPAIMLVSIIVAIICGQETTSIWNLAMWVFAVIFMQILVLNREKYIHKLKDLLESYDKLTKLYKKLTDDQESEIKNYKDILSKTVTDGNKEVWNLIIQSFDKHGSEAGYSVDTYLTEESVRKKYTEFLKEDREDKDKNVEETEGVLEYWYTTESGEMQRVKVVKSYVF